MAQVSSEILQIVNRYVAALEEHGIRLKAAVLFGSCASGKAHEWSDIDVALVSDDFQGDRFADREMIARPTLDTDCRIEPLPYRSEDFTEDDLFVREIVKTGVKIL